MSVSLAKGTKKIGSYQLGDVIGKGAMGFVSKGLNMETGTYVAIKQVALQNIKEDQLKSIQSEINLLKRLKHPNIVKYIDYIRTETHLNIVLEFVETGSLAYIIKRFGPFPEGLVAVYIKQVLIGLDYLHKQGVVHRDIKGANILTTKDGVVKLADFGVATRLTELTEIENSYSVVGTPYWMAPEIIEMRGHVSTSCDIWSVGCTVLELINGNPPYYPMQQYTAMWRIVHDDHPPLPDGISSECRDFLLACFEKDPMHRIDAAGLLQHRWIRSQNQREVYDIINSPNNELPEEVHNTIRLHIDDKSERNELMIDQPEVEQEGVFNPNNNIVNIMSGQEAAKEEHQEIAQSQFKKESILLYENLLPRTHEQDWAGHHDKRSQNNSYNNHFQGYQYQSPAQRPHIQDTQAQIQNTVHSNQIHQAQNQGYYYNQNNGEDYRTTWMSYNSHRGKYGDESSHFSSADRKQMNPNVGTIVYEEGSFVSVDNNVEHQGGTTMYLMGGSTVQMTSKTRQKEGGWGSGDGAPRSQKECKIYNDLNQIMEAITNLSDQEDFEGISKLLQDLTNLLKSHNKDHRYHKYIVDQYGFSIFLDIIENFEEHININAIILSVMCLINQIIDSDTSLLDKACLFGVLPYYLKFSVSEYPRQIRTETFYFIGKMFYSGKENMRLLIASGGLSVLAEFLDINYKDNKDFVSFALDFLHIIINEEDIMSPQNMWKMLCRYHILQRLILVIDQIHTDQDPSMEKYLFKALELLANFAMCEDKKMKTMLCEEDNLQLLKIMLTTFTSKEDMIYLREMIKIFRFIAGEPTVLNALENSGILPIVLNLIRLFITKSLSENEETLHDLIKIVFSMIKLNAPRQEQLVLCGGINILTYICKNTSKTLRKCALPILCYFVQTSTISRAKLWEAGGPRIYIDNLDDETYQAKLLDTLAVWLECDSDRVEATLIDSHTLPKLINIFCSANKANFEQIVPIYLKFISQSEKLGKKLGKTDEFLQELVERLGVDSLEKNTHSLNEQSEGEYSKFLKGNPNLIVSQSNFLISNLKKPLRPECSHPSALVRKEILDILLNLCLKHSDPRSLLNKHSLYPIIVKILHIAENENMVILEEISTQLLQIYSGESPLKANKFSLPYINVGEFAY